MKRVRASQKTIAHVLFTVGVLIFFGVAGVMEEKPITFELTLWFIGGVLCIALGVGIMPEEKSHDRD